MGTILHVWWSCPNIQIFWKEVHEIIVKVSDCPVVFTPQQYLLHSTPVPKTQYYKSLAMHMINAAC